MPRCQTSAQNKMRKTFGRVFCLGLACHLLKVNNFGESLKSTPFAAFLKSFYLNKVDILIVQSLYDHTQMLDQHQIVKHANDNSGDENKNGIFLKTLDLMSKNVKNSLNFDQSFFVSACVTHMIFTRR